MLHPTSPKEALLACPPCPPWNLPFFTVEFTLSSSCSRSDFPLIRQCATVAHLDSLPPHDLVLWTDGSLPFPFGKSGSSVLANCSLSVALRPLFSFQQALYVQVSLLKPAPFCTLFAGLGSTNKSAISLFFSFYLTLALSSPPYPLFHLFLYLNLSGRSSRSCFLSLPVPSGYDGSPDTRFSLGTTQLIFFVLWQGIYDPGQTREENEDRGFILLPPQSAVLPRSDAGSDGAEPAPCFVIQNC